MNYLGGNSRAKWLSRKVKKATQELQGEIKF